MNSLVHCSIQVTQISNCIALIFNLENISYQRSRKVHIVTNMIYHQFYMANQYQNHTQIMNNYLSRNSKSSSTQD
jgi:hypothetical protein